MPIEVLRSISPEEWDRYTDNNPSANIFHTRQFADCFTGSPSNTPYTFFLQEDGETIACLIALHTRILGPFPRLSSRSVIFGGVSCAHGLLDRLANRHIGTLLGAYDDVMQSRALYTEIRNLTDQTSRILPVTRTGYRFQPHLNYLIDLSRGSDAVWEDMSGDMRRMIRRSEKNGVQVVEMTSVDQIEVLYDLVARVYSKVHIPFFDKSVFREAWLRLAPLGRIRITFAQHEGKTIAARAGLVYKSRIFDWFAGSDETGDRLNANAVLIWDMLNWGSKAGHTTFDFGGAGDPNVAYKVRDFKSRFRGQMVNFGRFTKIYSPARYYLGYGAYAVLRRILF